MLFALYLMRKNGSKKIKIERRVICQSSAAALMGRATTAFSSWNRGMSAGTCLAKSDGMNTIQLHIQTPPPQPKTSQLNADNGASGSAAAPSQRFAAAMDDASAKPVRKAASNKTGDGSSSGSKLPAAGNPVPPAAVAVPHATPAKSTSSAVAAAGATNAKPVSAPIAQSSDADGTAQGQAAESADGSDNSAPAAAGAAQSAAAAGLAAGGAGPPLATNADAAQTGTAQAGAAQATAVGAGAVPTDSAPTNATQADAVGKDVSSALATKLPAGAVAASAGVAAAAKPDAASGAGAATAADTMTGQSDLMAAASSAAAAGAAQAGAVPTGADAGATAMAAAANGVAVQNSPSSAAAPVTAAPSQEMGPDAATVLGTAASATAAAAASAAQVITQLATTTAAERHSHGGVDATSTATASADGTAGAAQAMTGTASSSNTDAATAPAFKVGASVDSSEFGQGVANQVATMVGNNLSTAKLSVNPPALGPIEVRIAIQGDHAQILMMSHSAVTRDALQASTPKLREMLNGQGFGQVSVDISQRSFQDRTPTAQSYEWNSNADRSDQSAAASAAGSVVRAGSGILDAYA
jgi:flagellar hook-length control protein FliK